MKEKSRYIWKAILLFFITSLFNILQAGRRPPPPPPGGGGGGVGPGTPATPIDMYAIFLLIIAIFLVIYFYKKIKVSKV